MDPGNRSARARISQAWEISASIRVNSSDAIILPGRKILKGFFLQKPKHQTETRTGKNSETRNLDPLFYRPVSFSEM